MSKASLRFPLLGAAALALLAAMWAGLIRLGWVLPPIQSAWVADHGPLMISGFLGTLVSLKRALASAAMGARLSGLGLLALGAWLLRFGLARRTVRQTGLTRFIALCLLPGYGWLAFAGLSWVVWADRFSAGPWYDAMLHAVTLGFIFSMIFGHAPLILPAVTGRALPYRPYFYSHVILLHAALLLRVIGDLALQPSLRQWGGMLNVIAILLFLANTIWAVRSAAGNRLGHA